MSPSIAAHLRTLTRPVLPACLSAMIGLAALAGAATTAQSQDVQRIAAVVNEQVISVFDVQQRMQILIVSSGLPNTRETQRRIAPQVLRGLIDEALQSQEAQRLNIRVAQREIDEAIARVEQTNRIPAGGFETFLQRQGISISAAVDQIRNNIAWQKLLSRTVVPTIEIGEEEIDDVIARIEASRGVTESRVGEILLPVDNPADQAEIQSLAERLVQQIRNGADFQAIARQFSKSATAATGGDIGWIQPGELEAGLDAAIGTLTPGQVSDPIETADGVQIVLLIDQRTNEPPDPNDRLVRLRQLLLPRSEGQDTNARLAEARSIVASARGCEAFAAAAETSGTPQPAAPAEFRLRDLNDQLRALASSLPVGEPSTPLETPSGVQVIMVCDRAETAGPNRDEIRNTLLRERVGMLSRRYLRDLRRAAFVDLRV